MTEKRSWVGPIGVRTCPTGCGRAVSVGKLMCPSCWSKVPDHLQRDVNVSWRRYNRRPSGDVAEFRAVRQAYFNARDAAISAAS